ncbi:MAG: hypothetical protein JXA52_04915, partial [Planctomycetes bacterium]|nr:hypothetical protein [Planctomycetota bacterium]
MTSPLRSMTGFGSATLERAPTRAHIDIRTVNHRGLRINLRGQANLGVLEKELRDAVKEVIHRGNVDVTIEIIQTQPDAAAIINREVAASAVAALRDLAKQHGLANEIRPADILQVPGVLADQSHNGIAEEEWPVVIDALKQALAQVLVMREAEGEATARIFAEHITAVETFAQEVARRAPELSAQFRT